jgi:predicted dinucleotide-binding enzyme
VSAAGPNARAATLADTVASCDVLLLSTPWPATKEILAGAGDLSGKILIDAVNPILPGFEGLEVGATTSAAEMIAAWAPGARVVKAFNTIGSNIMADANLSGHAALLLYCGDDAEAKKIVRGLATGLGFDAEDAGPLKQARLLEPMALLWVTLAYAQGFGREFAFKIIRR